MNEISTSKYFPADSSVRPDDFSICSQLQGWTLSTGWNFHVCTFSRPVQIYFVFAVVAFWQFENRTKGNRGNTTRQPPPEQETHVVRLQNSLSIVERKRKRTSTPRWCCCCNSFGQFAYCVPIWKFPKWKYIYWQFFEQRTFFVWWFVLWGDQSSLVGWLRMSGSNRQNILLNLI